MINCFETEVAKDVGVVAAVLYQNIQYWCEHNRANRIHYHDGHYWTFNSIEAFTELFPYLTKNQINLALKKLEDSGYIKTGNYNKSAYDRTKWYTDIKGGCGVLSKDSPISTKTEMENDKCENGSMPNPKPIPNINTNNNQITNLKENVKRKFDAIAFLDEVDFIRDNQDLKTAWIGFIEMRNANHRPIKTEHALKLLINDSWKYGHGDPQQMIAVINQSTAASYQGIFELKGNANNSHQIAPRTPAQPKKANDTMAVLDALYNEAKAKEMEAAK